MQSSPNKYRQASGNTKTKKIYLRKIVHQTVHQSCDSKMHSQIFLKICTEILKHLWKK